MYKNEIVIINYGMGNLGSIANIIKKIGYESLITSNIEKIKNAKKLILPGVGSFDSGMKNINEFGLVEVLNKKVLEDKIPILGICLGMQLMTNMSEEGSLNGLGWIDAQAKKFVSTELKIPHMGWNVVKHNKESDLFSEVETEKRYYFVHSYYINCKNSNDILTTTIHGDEFVSAFERDNIFGVQFHPEKSHKFGMSLLENFIKKIR